jgi:hypothetical protein
MQALLLLAKLVITISDSKICDALRAGQIYKIINYTFCSRKQEMWILYIMGLTCILCIFYNSSCLLLLQIFKVEVYICCCGCFFFGFGGDNTARSVLGGQIQRIISRVHFSRQHTHFQTSNSRPAVVSRDHTLSRSKTAWFSWCLQLAGHDW